MLYICLLIVVFVVWRSVLVLHLKWYWKTLLASAVAAVGFKFQILHLFGGPMYFAPVLPSWILLGSAWLFTVLFSFFILLGAAEFLRLCILAAAARRKKISDKKRSQYNRDNLFMLAAAVVLAVVGIYYGTKVPEVRQVAVPVRSTDENIAKMRIVLLADLHADKLTRADRIREIVERCNALKPDLVLIVGDFVDGKVESCGEELLPLSALKARYGVFGVPGNHEYYSGFNEWMAFLNSIGVKMLVNSSVELPNKVVLAGVADIAGRQRRGPLPDLNKALEGVSADKTVFLMVHRPAFAHEAAADGRAVMQFSGHTHGGMVLGFNIIVGALNGGFSAGTYQVGDLSLYVSRGSGIWNGFPIRLGCPSEITLITPELEKK